MSSCVVPCNSVVLLHAALFQVGQRSCVGRPLTAAEQPLEPGQQAGKTAAPPGPTSCGDGCAAKMAQLTSEGGLGSQCWARGAGWPRGDAGHAAQTACDFRRPGRRRQRIFPVVSEVGLAHGSSVTAFAVIGSWTRHAARPGGRSDAAPRRGRRGRWSAPPINGSGTRPGDAPRGASYPRGRDAVESGRRVGRDG